MKNKKKGAHKRVRIVSDHPDGTPCPAYGARPTIHSTQQPCREPGRHRIRVQCDLCQKSIPAIHRLDAVETKAIHTALHAGPLTFRITVDDGNGPRKIRQVRALAAA